MTRLDEIKARAEAGTSGLWVNPHGAMEKYGYEFINSPSGIVASKIDNHANAEFIAHARTDVPRLVAALESVLELHKEVQWAESWPTCLHCNDGEGSPLAYPCLTVAAIQSALGEGEK